jgi:AbrB family looped-hinge helix DNA binding protein
MTTVTISPKYQVVIPKIVRDLMQLRPGQKMRVMVHKGRIELIPERELKELRGLLEGCDTDFRRDGDRV